MVGQVPADRLGAGVQARVAELFAEPQHQLDGLPGSGPWGTVRSPRAGLERGVAVGSVTG
jgi:hypothetical protein